MQVQLREIKKQMGYRFQSIVFGEDGSCYANVQICMINETNEGKNFEPVGTQSHNLSATDLAEIDCEMLIDQTDFRQLVEFAIESKLREKGLMRI